VSASNEIWILGANGRCGRAAAEALAPQHSLVLVGRAAARLQELADTLGGTARTVVADSIDGIAAALGRSGATVVVNTIGPFTQTALPIARACPLGCHYVDVSNELFALIDVLHLHDEAATAGRSLVPGAGFGVLATESVVLKLCEKRPPAARVRVDALPFVEVDEGAGPFGPTLAATIVEGLPLGGRRYDNGVLVRAKYGDDSETLTLPDGSTMVTGAMPTGDLEAARRASGASSVVAASNLAPSTPLARVLMSAIAPLFSSRAVREIATRRLAQVRPAPSDRKRDASWTHARVEWTDGGVREGWLRAGEAMAFTNAVTAEVASRLARGEGRPGAFTPGALFGPELAVHAGGHFIIDGEG
jgi:short subunit dehydrogenase-like uncharacterized protein